jgi:hypothetical protein
MASARTSESASSVAVMQLSSMWRRTRASSTRAARMKPARSRSARPPASKAA